ncbi:MAG: glycosyltransferase family 39 protein [Bacteroidetes bacterium]|nr:glycosyltransferase family 39 protein [Bacteroidota bacterium]
MKVVLLLMHLAIILFIAYRMAKKWNATSRRVYWAAFACRLAAGASLGLIYLYYYSANDTWNFFEESTKLSTFGRNDFVTYLKMMFDFGEDQSALSILPNHDLRSLFFVKVISVFALVSGDNYWIITAYFSLASFLTSWYLFRTIENNFPKASTSAGIAFLFFPSVVFWSSGIEKETLALCGIYYLSAVFIRLLKQRKIKWVEGLGILASVALVWNLKYYWAAVFFITVFTAIAVWILQQKKLWLSSRLLLTWIIVFIGAAVVASFSHPNFCFTTFLNVLVTNHDDFVRISDGKNLIHYYHLTATWQSVFINSPWAIVSGVLRPVVGEGQGMLGLVASVENGVLLLLLLTAIPSLRNKADGTNKIFLLAVLSYVLVLGVFLALSTPNLGSLSRYRIGFLPFLIFLIIYKNPLIQRLWPTRV